MRICRLDGEQIMDRGMLHDALAEHLELPDWYGRNLDALYDCLTACSEETRIEIVHLEALRHHLGKYTDLLLQVLKNASAENPCVQIEEHA